MANRVGGTVALRMVRPRSDWPDESMRDGLVFWLDQTGDAVMLIGSDAGVLSRTGGSTRSAGRSTPSCRKTTSGAWLVTRRVDEPARCVTVGGQAARDLGGRRGSAGEWKFTTVVASVVPLIVSPSYSSSMLPSW